MIYNTNINESYCDVEMELKLKHYDEYGMPIYEVIYNSKPEPELNIEMVFKTKVLKQLK